MIIDDIKNIAVIGAGNMGHQIAMLSLRANMVKRPARDGTITQRIKI